MIGVIANTISVLVGSCIGLLARKVIPSSWNDIILKGMGLISFYIGITGMMNGKNTLVLVICIVLGAMIGEGIDIDGRFNRFAERLQARFTKEGEQSTFAEGLITASLIFCVGAMTIVGPMDAALRGNNDLLFTKTVMDGCSSIVISASLGAGVIFSAVIILIVQGGIYLLASAVAPVLTTDVIAEMTCAGSLLILALGLNLVGATKLKVMNYLPAIFLPIAILPLYQLIAGMVGSS